MNLRISVSDLCCYQRYRDNEYMTLEECVAQIRRELPPTPAMDAGKALHAALEHAEYDFEIDCLQWDGYKFFFQCEADVAIPDVRELKGEIEILTAAGAVTFVGVVDSIGGEICDYKLTGNYDAERLMDSWQWRCYLSMFGAFKFTYKVFIGEEIKPKEWAIKGYEELPVYRYPGMEHGIQQEVEQCAFFIQKYVQKAA